MIKTKPHTLKLLAFILAAALLAPLLLSGCSSKQAGDGKIHIVCTLFPQYDWLRNIVGDSDNIELTLLIHNGTDPHSYQPTAADIKTVSDCDMIVYIGGNSDTWVSEALERAKNTDIERVALSALEGVTLHSISSTSHGHSHGEESDHGHASHEGHDHGVFDEHLWLSLRNAMKISEALAQRLSELDAENAELYSANARAYIDRLSALDQKYASLPSKESFMLFADRFPFVYMLSDYGVHYKAAFEGCTTDVDAGFDTVLSLIKEAEAHSLRYIMITESSDGSLARTVAGSVDGYTPKILTLDSLQAITQGRIDGGETYLSVMEKNFEVFKTAICADRGE